LRAATSPACWSEITQAHPAQPTLAQRPQEPAPEHLAGRRRQVRRPQPGRAAGALGPLCGKVVERVTAGTPSGHLLER
jgi:hypothetical protein